MWTLEQIEWASNATREADCIHWPANPSNALRAYLDRLGDTVGGPCAKVSGQLIDAVSDLAMLASELHDRPSRELLGELRDCIERICVSIDATDLADTVGNAIGLAGARAMHHAAAVVQVAVIGWQPREALGRFNDAVQLFLLAVEAAWLHVVGEDFSFTEACKPQ